MITATELCAKLNIYQGMMILQYCQRFSFTVIVNSDPEVQIQQTYSIQEFVGTPKT